MFVDVRGDMTAQAFAAEGMSTRLRTSDRIIGHLFQTYAAYEQSLGELGKLCTLRGERAVFTVKFVLQAHRIQKVFGSIIVVRGWSRYATRDTKCFTGARAHQENMVLFLAFLVLLQ